MQSSERLTDDYVDENAKRSFEVIRLLVFQEVAHDDDGQDEDDNVEDLEIEIHGFAQAPADDDYE